MPAAWHSGPVILSRMSPVARLTGLASALILVLSAVACQIAMQVLGTDALRQARQLCASGQLGVMWTKGYGVGVPISALILPVVAGLVLGVAFPIHRRVWWCLALVVLAVAAMLTVLGGVALHDFFAFPGGDVTTVDTSPCGAG